MRLARVAAFVGAFGAMVVACGARTGALEEVIAPGQDAGRVADAFVLDAASVLDTSAPDTFAAEASEVEAGPCEDDQNTSFAPADCGGPDTLWFAWPYSPARDMTVERIELHTSGGGVALLASRGGLPGPLLFQGTTPMTTQAAWTGVNLVPPVDVTGGQPYWLAERVTLCSQSLGGIQLIEYQSSSLAGPWITTGTGSYTDHVIGVCR